VVKENGRTTEEHFIPRCITSIKSLDPGDEVELEVRQNLADLRAEQEYFAVVARLIAEIQREDKERSPEKMFEYCRDTASEIPLLLEDFFEMGEALKQVSKVSLTSAVSQLAESYLCTILDKFPARLFQTSDRPIELPPLDAYNIGHGIIHALYCMLRLEYLRRGRLGLGVCRRCDEVFAIERSGAVFCGNKCSHLYRSNEHYHLSGKAARQERAKSKVTNAGENPSRKSDF
jgi:hypothetical protein